MEVLMAKKETHVAPKVQSRKEWFDAVEQGTKTKAQAIARCKHMISKKGDSFHGKQWTLFLNQLEGKPKAKAKPKASPKVDQSITSLSKAELVEIVQAFMKKAK